MLPTALPPDAILNGALAGFNGAIDAYFPLLLIWGFRLLSAVVFVGFGYAVLLAVLQHDWFGTFMSMAWVGVKIGLVYVFMANLETWGPAFPIMGQTIGTAVSGQSPNVLTPSGFVDLGLTIFNLLHKANALGSWFDIPSDLAFLILLALILLTWFAAACIYMWTLIECKWYVATGSITICFASFEHTWGTFENWLLTLLQVGIKLLAMMVILAISLLLANGWISNLNALGTTINEDDLGYVAFQLVEAGLVFYAMWTLPKKAAGIIQSRGASGDLGGEGGEALFAAATSAAQFAGGAVANSGKVGSYIVRKL